MNNKINPTNQTTFSLGGHLHHNNEKSNLFNKAKVTSLVRDPIQNRNTTFVIKDSSISSLIEYSNNLKQLAKEKKNINYKTQINDSLKSSNAIVKYLQSPFFLNNSDSNSINQHNSSLISQPETLNLVGKKNKIQGIKEINLSDLLLSNSQPESLISSYNPEFALKKLIELKKIKKNKKNKKNKLEKKRIKEQVTIIPRALATEVHNKKNLLMTNMNLINFINPFNSNLAQSNSIMFFFNKKNTFNIFKNGKNIAVILEAAFYAMNSLISKACISAKPDSIMINLFFFWKFNVLKYLVFSLKTGKIKMNQRLNSLPTLVFKNLMKKLTRQITYSKLYSKFGFTYNNYIISLTKVLTILLNKKVNFHFTRIYYPYNDSRIMAEVMGFLSFFLKFNFIVLQLFRKIIFRIRKKRLLRLKYRNIPSVITGMNVKLAGRISKVRNNNRSRTKKWQLGNLTRSVNSLRVKNKFTNKSINGVFSINVNTNAIILK